jgi:hypothetical protein
MGAWVAEYRGDPARHHERCAVLIPQPAIPRRRSAFGQGQLRRWYSSNPASIFEKDRVRRALPNIRDWRVVRMPTGRSR